MILEDGKPLRRPLPWRISDYLWGIFPALVSLFTFIALWQYGHASLGAMLIPAPDVVLTRVAEILGNAVERQNVILTLQRGSIGISLALSLGIGIGLIAGSSCTLSPAPSSPYSWASHRLSGWCLRSFGFARPMPTSFSRSPSPPCRSYSPPRK